MAHDFSGRSMLGTPRPCGWENPIAAEQAAVEIPFIPLAEARALVELCAEKRDRTFERAALRYLARYLAEASPSLADVAQAAALLAEPRRSCEWR